MVLRFIESHPGRQRHRPIVAVTVPWGWLTEPFRRWLSRAEQGFSSLPKMRFKCQSAGEPPGKSLLLEPRAKGMGMKIIRTSIVLCGLAVLLPSPPEDGAAGKQPGPSGFAVAAAAADAVGDARGFCGRQPAVCDTTGHVLRQLERKAKYAARLIYEWASDSSGAPRPARSREAHSDPITTGATAPRPAAQRVSQNTLHLEDLIPEWRSPLGAARS
jgi:hypothetical protein